MTHQTLSLGKCWKLFWATLKFARKQTIKLYISQRVTPHLIMHTFASSMKKQKLHQDSLKYMWSVVETCYFPTEGIFLTKVQHLPPGKQPKEKEQFLKIRFSYFRKWLTNQRKSRFFFWRKSVFRDVRMQSCFALRFLVTLSPPLHETFAFLSNIRPRLACMRTSRKTDFRLSENNFRRQTRHIPRAGPRASLSVPSFALVWNLQEISV